MRHLVDDYADALAAAIPALANLDESTKLAMQPHPILSMLSNASPSPHQPDMTITDVLAAQAKLEKVPKLYVEDPFVPLTRTDAKDGAVIEVLAWKFNGTYRVHPKRMELFLALLDRAAAAIAKEST